MSIETKISLAEKIKNAGLDPRTAIMEFAQELGTDVIRKYIDEDFFINRIIDDIKVYSYYFDALK